MCGGVRRKNSCDALRDNKLNSSEIGPTRIKMFLVPIRPTINSICQTAAAVKDNAPGKFNFRTATKGPVGCYVSFFLGVGGERKSAIIFNMNLKPANQKLALESRDGQVSRGDTASSSGALLAGAHIPAALIGSHEQHPIFGSQLRSAAEEMGSQI